MHAASTRHALAAATAAARQAGHLLRQNLRAAKAIQSATQHDIKLELDVRCQRLLERALRRALPQSAILGEEGVVGDPGSPLRWVVDPIDGTVNFTYGIPHACISIALQHQPAGAERARSRAARRPEDAPGAEYATLLGVVYDPFCEELWTAVRGGPARLNGRPVRVSRRSRLAETVISLGFGKKTDLLNHMLPAFKHLVHRVRKIRIMGAAALALTYVASGRFDAFIEAGVRLWDIAAGGLILECAGGEFWHRPMPGEHVYEVRANNGRLRRHLERRARLQ